MYKFRQIFFSECLNAPEQLKQKLKLTEATETISYYTRGAVADPEKKLTVDNLKF